MAAVMTAPGSSQQSAPERKRSRTAYYLLLPGMGWLAVFFAIPFVTLFLTSLQVPVPGTSGQYMPAFEIMNYPDAFSAYSEQFLRSLVYAGTATILALIIAYPLAYFIAFRGGQWKGLLLV
jgi:spermidine/putrescine transport system permease protein